ncbi:TPA: LPXTG cell wall anchor domain-containing protein [Streptococcus suis]
MKIKRSSRKKRLAKLSKLGLSLAAVTVLGGLVELVDVPLLSNCTVEAQELTNQSGSEQALPADTATVTIELENTGVVELVGASYRYQRIRGFERLEIHLQPGETYTLPTYDGHKLINFKNLNEVTDIAPEDAILSYADFTPGQRVRLYYDYLMIDQVYDAVTKQYVDRETVIPSTTPSINSPTDTPTAPQPAETPAEQPKQVEPAGATSSTDTPSVPQPTNSQPTVEDRYDVVTLQYRDENGEDFGDDLMMVYPTSSQRITPPTFEGYEFKEASVGENYLMYRKPISLPYEHRFAQVLTEQDLQSHSNFLGGRIKETQDSLRDGSAYTYILNYRKTGPSQQAPQTKRVRFIIDVKPDVVTGTSSFDGFSRRFADLHPGESYTFPVDESKFEIRPNQKLTYSYDEVEAGKDYSISVRPKAVTSQPADKPVETPTAPQPAETPVVTSVDKPVESPVDPSVSKPAETPAKSPAETPTNQPSTDQAEQSSTEPTVLSKQDSQAGTASPTSQSAPGKQETKQETKEQATPASQSKQSTDKPASTSQSQAKTLPATGEASSVLHLTGLGLLGLAGLVVRRRSGKSS